MEAASPSDQTGGLSSAWRSRFAEARAPSCGPSGRGADPGGESCDARPCAAHPRPGSENPRRTEEKPRRTEEKLRRGEEKPRTCAGLSVPCSSDPRHGPAGTASRDQGWRRVTIDTLPDLATHTSVLRPSPAVERVRWPVQRRRCSVRACPHVVRKTSCLYRRRHGGCFRAHPAHRWATTMPPRHAW